jgi:hypothetical protein
MTNNWEQVAKGLEEIDFAALADDEKAALPPSMPRTLDDMITAVKAGECSTKIAARIERAVGRLIKQADEWRKLRLWQRTL